MNITSASVLDALALDIDGGNVDPWVGARLSETGLLWLERESGEQDEVAVTSCGPGILRVRIGPERPSTLLAKFDEVAIPLTREGSVIAAATGDLEARWYANGDFSVGPLSRTSGDGSMGGPGLRPGAVVQGGRVAGWLERFDLDPYTSVFGGGESTQGPDLRGRMRHLRNVETSGFSGYDLAYLNVPFLWSPDGWGMFAHTGAALRADIGATVSDVLSVVTCDASLDLFFFAGEPQQVMRDYLSITGVPGDLPPWALGTWMSRCSYYSEAELHELLDEAERAGCPVDVINVDAWQEGEALVDLACNWSPDTRRFPAGWVARLRERGVRVCLWHNPYVPAGSEAAVEAYRLGLFALMPDGSAAESADIPGRLLLDFTNEATIVWWHRKVFDLVAVEGVSAIKCDFGEEVPDEALFSDGRTGAELRNEYAHIYQRESKRALDEALAEGEVGAMFVRSGTAGSQRTPCHWVGDSASTWTGLASTLRSTISLSLSGFAWVSHDIGGFWVAGSDAHMRASHDGDPSHYTADVDPELYLRWTQWGAFSPVMRFHGAGRREPFAYPPPYGALAVEATRVRRRLRPYLEECGLEARRSGTPVMRGMPFAYPANHESHGALQYMLGSDVLVVPLLAPGGRARVWFPPGSWRQILGDAVVTGGGGWTEVHCALDEFPAFVRNDPLPQWYRDFTQSQ